MIGAMVSPTPGPAVAPDPTPDDARLPVVGVVVLNWNGAWFTRRALSSLLALDYPAHLLRIVLVDNGSVDGSLEELTHWLDGLPAGSVGIPALPRIEVIANGANLGFAEGCNRAIRHLLQTGPARVDHVALLNNDACAERGWLRSMLAVMEADDRCAAVSSRLLLEPTFAAVDVDSGDSALTLLSAQLTPGDRQQKHGGGVPAAIDVLGRVRTTGFSDEGALDWPPRRVWRLAPHSSGRIWVPAGAGTCTVSVALADESGAVGEVTRSLATARTTLLNGLGTGLNESGEGYDIGYGEPDPWSGEQPPHSNPFAEHAVRGFCGGSVLLRAAALDEVGLFDPAFFAYYEDTDLAWRLRRAGWRVTTAQAAVAHHAFGASGGGGSRWHVFLDRRNWLVTNFRNGDEVERRRALGWLWRGAWRLFRVNVFGKLRRGRRPQLQPLLTWKLAALTALVRTPRARRTARPGWRRTNRVRGAFQPTGSPRSPEPWPGGPLVVYVDVGETLKAGYRAGIQRVVCAVVAELPGADDRVELVPIRWCERNGRFRRITGEEYASLLRSGGTPELPDDSATVAGAKDALRATAERLGVIDPVRRGREQVFGARRRAVEDSLVLDSLAPGAVLLEVDAVWNETGVDRQELLGAERARGVRVATFVHDLLPLTNPDWFAPRLHEIFDPTALAQLRCSELVLCASAATEAQVGEVCDREGIELPRVSRVPLGATLVGGAGADGDQPVGGGTAVLPGDLGTSPYVLVVGTLEPRKNHEVVLDAFDSLRADGADLRLVVVGRYGWGSDALVERIRNHRDHGSRLHWFDDAHDDLLGALYGSAAVMLVPSRTEGFGLPAIEALSHGVPVVASPGGALGEVLGAAPPGAVRFADPDSPGEWAEAIAGLLGDDDARAAAAGAAAGFDPPSWRRTAEGFAEELVSRFGHLPLERTGDPVA